MPSAVRHLKLVVKLVGIADTVVTSVTELKPR